MLLSVLDQDRSSRSRSTKTTDGLFQFRYRSYVQQFDSHHSMKAKSMNSSKRFRVLLLCGICGVSTDFTNQVRGGEKHSLLNSKQNELTIGSGETFEANDILVIKSETASSNTNIPEASVAKANSGSETVRERFQDGRIRIERQVTLDSEGNYINHGAFTEWTANGDIVASGTYEMGLRHGPWIKSFKANEAKIFSSPPYSYFKAPFLSTVEFNSGEMNGVWTITDADKRVVSEIQLENGIRSGQASWFHPNGKPLYRSEYLNGVLNGLFVEQATDGKVIRQEKYIHGQRNESEQEFSNTKKLLREANYVSAKQSVATRDEWSTATLATYQTEGEKIKHGVFNHYFENGQLHSTETFELGALTGASKQWHANGEKASEGVYQNGARHGKWSWWHPNGMRSALVTFNQGQIEGEQLAWNEDGKRIALPREIVDNVVPVPPIVRLTNGSTKPTKVRHASILQPSENITR